MTTPTYRDAGFKLWPWGGRTGYIRRIYYAMQSQIDVLAQNLTAAMKLRFPGVFPDALPYLGRERRIRRGRLESAPSYASRLDRWLTDHQRRGGPYALLEQLYATLPTHFPIDLVYKSGRRFRMDASGNITTDILSVIPTTQWARWTLYYFTDAYPTLSAEDIEDLTIIPKEWNAAHCQGVVIILPSDGELWGYPTGRLWGESGTWGHHPITRLEI